MDKTAEWAKAQIKDKLDYKDADHALWLIGKIIEEWEEVE